MEAYNAKWDAYSDIVCRYESMRNKCTECVNVGKRLGMLGSVLCAECEERPCSICGDTEYELVASDWDHNPICEDCKENQCYQCGYYGEGLTETHHGKYICEDCGLNWCNQCGDYDGGCDYRCPYCEAPCDSECQCTIECAKCGEEFEYDGYDLDRCVSDETLKKMKVMCPECREKID